MSDEHDNDEYRDDLAWHALNYRTAHPMHAEAAWQELAACMARKQAEAAAGAPTPIMRILAGAAFLPQNRDRPLGELRSAADIIFGTEAIEAALMAMWPNAELSGLGREEQR